MYLLYHPVYPSTILTTSIRPLETPIGKNFKNSQAGFFRITKLNVFQATGLSAFLMHSKLKKGLENFTSKLAATQVTSSSNGQPVIPKLLTSVWIGNLNPFAGPCKRSSNATSPISSFLEHTLNDFGTCLGRQRLTDSVYTFQIHGQENPNGKIVF